jgi:hypothetical protein
LNYLQGVTVGTGAASKALVLNADQSITTGFKNLTLSGNLSLAGNITGLTSLEIAGNIMSSANMEYDLGSESNPFRAVYCQDLVMVSDARKKRDVQDLGYGLNQVMSLRPVSYQWVGKEDPKRSLGLIAQEVEGVMDEVVRVGNDAQESMGVQYVNLIPVLIKAIQEQQEYIARQEERIKILESSSKQ